MKLLGLTVLLGLAGCGYQPPPHTDTSSPAYLAARDACTDSATSAVNKKNAKTGLAWLSSPVRRWGQIDDATGACMDGKGFGRVRWCTPEELRDGSRRGNRVVTSAGVQCSDPPTRPADTSPSAPAPTTRAATRSPT